MPELPEVETIVKELKDEILGKRISSIEIRDPKVFFGKKEGLIEQKIENIKRRAKLIILNLNKENIVIHLKLTGQLFFLEKNKEKTKTEESINKFTRAIFNFTDDSKLIFNDLRRFGFIKVLNDKKLEKLVSNNNYGPEPLNPDFTKEKFKKMLKKRLKARIKPLLMDQGFIAGIGNIYADEALFYAKILPKRQAGSIKGKEADKLYKGIKEILRSALKHKGTSIDTYRRTTGEKGTFESHRKVYRRTNEPCSICKTLIKRVKIGGRSAHFCPKCQK